MDASADPVDQAVAADGCATVETGRRSQPVADHGDDGDLPALRQSVGQVGDGQKNDADEVDLLGAYPVDEPPGEGAEEPGDQHADAVDHPQLGLRRPQRHDVDGKVGKDHLVGELVEGGAQNGYSILFLDAKTSLRA